MLRKELGKQKRVEKEAEPKQQQARQKKMEKDGTKTIERREDPNHGTCANN
jgi:hypothetical protein